MALAVLSGCDRDAPRDDPRASSPAYPLEKAPAPISSMRPMPAEEAPGKGVKVEIADPGGGAKALPTAGPALLPLTRILQIVRARVPGEVIDVELDDEDGRPEYEITILTADGRSIETQIDAVNGTIRKSEED